MFRFIAVFLVILSFNFHANSHQLQQNLSFHTKSAKKMLVQSEFNNDFYQLVNFYQPQINPLYCGVASSVIILNALNNGDIKSQKSAEISKPKSLGGGLVKFRSYLQSNFLNEATNKIKHKDIIEFKRPKYVKNNKEFYDPGLTLSDLANILRKTHKLRVRKIYAKRNDEKSLARFRKNLKKYLSDDKSFILVNFSGKVLKTKTGGHISPLAAYHEPSDSVLVLDVATHKQTWYFTPVENLYKAMNTKDGKKFRGYLIVSR